MALFVASLALAAFASTAFGTTVKFTVHNTTDTDLQLAQVSGAVDPNGIPKRIASGTAGEVSFEMDQGTSGMFRYNTAILEEQCIWGFDVEAKKNGGFKVKPVINQPVLRRDLIRLNVRADSKSPANNRAWIVKKVKVKKTAPNRSPSPGRGSRLDERVDDETSSVSVTPVSSRASTPASTPAASPTGSPVCTPRGDEKSDNKSMSEAASAASADSDQPRLVRIDSRSNDKPATVTNANVTAAADKPAPAAANAQKPHTSFKQLVNHAAGRMINLLLIPGTKPAVPTAGLARRSSDPVRRRAQMGELSAPTNDRNRQSPANGAVRAKSDSELPSSTKANGATSPTRQYLSPRDITKPQRRVRITNPDAGRATGTLPTQSPRRASTGAIALKSTITPTSTSHKPTPPPASGVGSARLEVQRSETQSPKPEDMKRPTQVKLPKLQLTKATGEFPRVTSATSEFSLSIVAEASAAADSSSSSESSKAQAPQPRQPTEEEWSEVLDWLSNPTSSDESASNVASRSGSESSEQ